MRRKKETGGILAMFTKQNVMFPCEEYFYSISDLAGHLVWMLSRALEAN